jgi:hypothetical protein
MQKIDFLKSIDWAIKDQVPIAAVFNTGEIIITPVNFLQTKREYYFNSYDEKCRLNTNNDIIITDLIKTYDKILLLIQEKIGT